MERPLKTDIYKGGSSKLQKRIRNRFSESLKTVSAFGERFNNKMDTLY